MKKTLIALATLSLAGASYAAPEIVCVNNEKIPQISQYAQKVLNELKNRQLQLQQEIEKEIAPLRQKLQAIEQQIQSGLLTEKAKKEKEEEAAKIRQKINEIVMKKQREFQEYAQNKTQEVINTEKAALEVLSKTMGYKAVTDCRFFIYFNPSINVTEQVAKIMDQIGLKKEKQPKK